MTNLVLAAVSFAAMHLLISGTRLRGMIVGRIGENAFRGAFSAVSAIVLGWLIWAYGQQRQPMLTPLSDWRWLSALLVLVAFTFIVLGLTTPGPTIVGGEKLMTREDPARGIHRVTRHPFLWGIALWGVVHALFNPEPVNLWFFGTFVVVAAAGTFSIDAKREAAYGETWLRYEQLTSNIPFAAIAQRRNRLVLAEIGWLRPAAAVAVYVVLSLLHRQFFGLPPF